MLKVGLNPKIPHRDEGTLIEPPVSVPNANGINPAATATADPPLEPPEILSKDNGFFVSPKKAFFPVIPAANSLRLFVPSNIYTAFLIRFIIVESDLDIWSESIFDPAVNRTFLTAIISLTEKGIPWRGPL